MIVLLIILVVLAAAAAGWFIYNYSQRRGKVLISSPAQPTSHDPTSPTDHDEDHQ